MTIASRRRSMASAIAPAHDREHEHGHQLAEPEEADREVEPVSSKTWNGTTTATISSPKSEIDRPRNSSRKSR